MENLNNKENEIKKEYSEKEIKSIRLNAFLTSCLFFLFIGFLLSLFVINYFYISDDYIPKEVRKFMNIISLYQNNYLNDYEMDDMIDGAIAGLVVKSGDKYGTYLPPSTGVIKSSILSNGGYFGLGITYTKHENCIEIVGVVENSPAANAGLKIGDVVKYINNEPINLEMLERFSNSVQEKSMRKYTFLLDTGKQITMIADEIETQKVNYFIKDNVGYISIYTFVPGTSELFKEAFDEITKANVRHIVLDLRGNTGGDVEVVVDMLNYITSDCLLVKLDNVAAEDKEYISDKNCAYDSNIPMSIVVNSSSASASELMTMALQDIYNCKVYGEKTYGKSTVLSVYTFEDNSMFVLSSGLYYPPSGRMIEGVGVTPDVLVPKELISNDIDYIYNTYIKK